MNFLKRWWKAGKSEVEYSSEHGTFVSFAFNCYTMPEETKIFWNEYYSDYSVYKSKSVIQTTESNSIILVVPDSVVVADKINNERTNEPKLRLFFYDRNYPYNRILACETDVESKAITLAENIMIYGNAFVYNSF
jgi:hypothetical protein